METKRTVRTLRGIPDKEYPICVRSFQGNSYLNRASLSHIPLAKITSGYLAIGYSRLPGDVPNQDVIRRLQDLPSSSHKDYLTHQQSVFSSRSGL